jgi:hypothetical protein
MRRDASSANLPGPAAEASGREAPLIPLLLDVMHGRVGSTVLMNLLGTSREVAFEPVYPFENRYLTPMVQMAGGLWWHPDLACGLLRDGAAGDALGFVPEIVSPSDLGPSTLEAMWCAFSGLVRARAGNDLRFYAEKALFPPHILDGILETRVIALVRDPRDVLVSIRAFNDRRGAFAFGRERFDDEPPYVDWFISHVGERLRSLVSSHGPHRILLRYEDLVADVPETARRLEHWLGVELDVSAAQAWKDWMPRHISSADVTHSIGRWRGELGSEEAESIWAALEPFLTPLGYRP